MKKMVVHVSKSKYDVYIGRGLCPITNQPSKWGNPFLIGKDGTRAEVIKKYREWVIKQPELMASLNELRGKRLGCWCGGSKSCHGDVLAELANAPDAGKESEPDIFG